jgi:hypothetical protein
MFRRRQHVRLWTMRDVKRHAPWRYVASFGVLVLALAASLSVLVAQAFAYPNWEYCSTRIDEFPNARVVDSRTYLYPAGITCTIERDFSAQTVRTRLTERASAIRPLVPIVLGIGFVGLIWLRPPDPDELQRHRARLSAAGVDH